MVELLCAADLSVTVADQQMNGCAWSTTKYSSNQPLLPLCLLSDRYPMSYNYFLNPKQARLALVHSFKKPFTNCMPPQFQHPKTDTIVHSTRYSFKFIQSHPNSPTSTLLSSNLLTVPKLKTTLHKEWA